MFITQPEKSVKKTPGATSAIPMPEVTSAASLAATAMLAACGGGGGAAPGASTASGIAGINPVSAADADAARFLQQAQFSSAQAEIADVRQSGYASWLARQFGAPLGPTGWDWLEARGYGQVDANSYFNDT